jgi:hypothetical protein
MLGAIQALLERPHVDGHDAAGLARTLREGPWCWPVEAAALARARRFVPDGPPRLLPGRALLVTADPGLADLWALEVGLDDAPTDAEALRFGSKAAASWDVAVVTLPRALPVLWSSVARWHDAWLRAVHLVVRPTSAAVAAPAPSRAARERLLDGPSFGLSFLLALTSLVLDEPLPEDLVASAQLLPGGQLGEVGGLPEKIEIVAREAPTVRRLLVCARQERAARAASRAAGARVEVVGVATAAAAIDATLGSVLVERLVAAGRDPGRRHELVEAFFRLVLLGRRGVVDWSPVARAAAVALAQWDGLDADDRRRLEFAAAVALRHEENRGRLPVLDARWLAGLPAPLRLTILANYVQQSADAGEPAPARVIAEATPHLVRGPEAFAPHLGLLGAVGRLLAVSGEPARALAHQMEAARGLLERMERESVSFPLAEWYRLAGALGERAAFDAAEAVRRDVEAQGGLGPGRPYVELARARALVALGAEPGDAEETLERLGRDEEVPSHVRWSAVRWHVRLREEQGLDATAVLARFDVAAGRGEAEARRARPFRVLVELDRAVRGGDGAAGVAALAELAALQPGVVGHLARAAAPAEAAAAVARLFPY